MMNEVMRLTTFFATLAVTSLFATSVAIAAAGIANTSGTPLFCRNCIAVTGAPAKPPNPSTLHSRRAPAIGQRPA